MNRFAVRYLLLIFPVVVCRAHAGRAAASRRARGADRAQRGGACVIRGSLSRRSNSANSLVPSPWPPNRTSHAICWKRPSISTKTCC